MGRKKAKVYTSDMGSDRLRDIHVYLDMPYHLSSSVKCYGAGKFRGECVLSPEIKKRQNKVDSEGGEVRFGSRVTSSSAIES